MGNDVSSDLQKGIATTKMRAALMGDDANLQLAATFSLFIFIWEESLLDTVDAHTCHCDRYLSWVHNCLIAETSRRWTRLTDQVVHCFWLYELKVF